MVSFRPCRCSSAPSKLHGERCGFNSTGWDEHFLDLLEKDPVALTQLTHADYGRFYAAMRGETVQKIRNQQAIYSMAAQLEDGPCLFEKS